MKAFRIATAFAAVCAAMAGTSADATRSQPLLKRALRMNRGGADGAVRLPNYPRYTQCDSKWGTDEMGVPGNGERSTICGEGCAMTSTAMVLAGLGVRLDDAPVTPKTLNAWLINNKQYYCAAEDCNNLNITFEDGLPGGTVMRTIGETQKPLFDELAYSIEAGAIANVAHVRNRTHFVLLTAPIWNETAFKVHDPFYPSTTYKYDDIADIIRYKIVRYPLYKQCNASWANNQLSPDGPPATICEVGCLMSSTSMALAGAGIPINGKASNPEVLNAWLRANGGYTNESDMHESKIAEIAPTRIRWPSDGMRLTNDVPMRTLQEWLTWPTPRIMIANVMHGQHFVLVTGWVSGTDQLYVNDPGFNRLTYSYSTDVVGWRIFDMA